MSQFIVADPQKADEDLLKPLLGYNVPKSKIIARKF